MPQVAAARNAATEAAIFFKMIVNTLHTNCYDCHYYYIIIIKREYIRVYTYIHSSQSTLIETDAKAATTATGKKL